ncbi:MAG: DUF4097 family beta strand repeat-containing protein [Cellulosilyticaceae bacterium]
MLRKRTIASIAVCMIGVGVGLSIVGVTLGGHMGVSFSSTGITWGPKASEFVSVSSGGRQVVENEVLTPFKQMNLDIGVSNVYVVDGEDYSISIDMNQDIPIRYEIRGDELYVTQRNIKHIGGINGRVGNVTITVPKDVTLEEGHISMGVGNWEIGGFALDKLSVDGGVGNLKITDTVARKLEIEAGVGNMTLDRVTSDQMRLMGGMGDYKGRNLVANKIYAEGGVGNIELQGTFKGDIEVSGGMGNIEVTTTEPLSAYAIDVSKGVGSVSINDQKIRGLDDYRSHSGGQYLLEVDCGVGNVSINTGEN